MPLSFLPQFSVSNLLFSLPCTMAPPWAAFEWLNFYDARLYTQAPKLPPKPPDRRLLTMPGEFMATGNFNSPSCVEIAVYLAVKTLRVIILEDNTIVYQNGILYELMEVHGGQGGEFARMIKLPQVTTKNDDSKYAKLLIEGMNSTVLGKSITSGVNFSSGSSTSMLYLFSRVFSMGTPSYSSIPYDPDGHIFESTMKISSYLNPSQWGLFAFEWGNTMGKHDEYISKDPSFAFIFLRCDVFNLCNPILQHYHLAAMGHQLTTGLKEKTISKLMIFEMKWCGIKENISTPNSEANLVSSLVGDMMFLLVTYGSVFDYPEGLLLILRISHVMDFISVIGSMYSTIVLLRNILFYESRDSSLIFGGGQLEPNLSVGSNVSVQSYYVSFLKNKASTLHQYYAYLMNAFLSFIKGLYKVGPRNVRLRVLSPFDVLHVIKPLLGLHEKGYWLFAQIKRNSFTVLVSFIPILQVQQGQASLNNACIELSSASAIVGTLLGGCFVHKKGPSQFTQWDPGGCSLVYWRSQHAWRALHQNENSRSSSSEVEETDAGGFY